MDNIMVNENIEEKNIFTRIASFFLIKKNKIVDIAYLLFIFLFVYAALTKLLNFPRFRVQLGQSPILTAFASWVAWIIPLIEIVISITLAIPRFRLLGLYASFSLMTLFTGYIIEITRFSDYIPCSCGGILQNMSWNQHLLFNIFFTGLSVVGILFYPKKK